ncbi:anti-sigma factor domain-containing protein [Neobacillus mesonae]|uniref:anti-sigma factor domain-containing protein n=1 Tax=Neobacillus mesonae TaxID=1193713 RepID=UPI0025742A16|nr:anti-sigma factor domain-containing protein [Neobacillus mesonae]
MKKGIVMEIEGAFLTLLTPEGEFLRAKRQDQPYIIGEEIYFYPVPIIKKTNNIQRIGDLFRFKPVWIVTLALIIILGSLFPIIQNDKAYAYMSIDVNPSIELGVNNKMQVIELTGFNEAGKKIVSDMSEWKKQDVSQLTKTLLLKIKQAGFLDQNQQVIFSTVRTKEEDKDAEEKLQEHIKEIKAAINSQALEVTVVNCTEKELKKAHQLGVTAGKYEANNRNKAKINVKTSEKKNAENSYRAELKKNQTSQIPGQYKKQSIFSSENKDGENENKSSGKKIPPGQLKKMNGEKVKNFGQLKKEKNQQFQAGQKEKQQTKLKEKQQTKQQIKNQQTKQQTEQQTKQQTKQQKKDAVKHRGNNKKHPQQRNKNREEHHNHNHNHKLKQKPYGKYKGKK